MKYPGPPDRLRTEAQRHLPPDAGAQSSRGGAHTFGAALHRGVRAPTRSSEGLERVVRPLLSIIVRGDRAPPLIP